MVKHTTGLKARYRPIDLQRRVPQLKNLKSPKLRLCFASEKNNLDVAQAKSLEKEPQRHKLERA